MGVSAPKATKKMTPLQSIATPPSLPSFGCGFCRLYCTHVVASVDECVGWLRGQVELGERAAGGLELDLVLKHGA